MGEVAAHGSRRYLTAGVGVAGLLAGSWWFAPSQELPFALAVLSTAIYGVMGWRLSRQVHAERKRVDALKSDGRQSEDGTGAHSRPNHGDSENAHYFQLLMEGVRDYSIVTLDPDGCVASWNAGAERITGYASEDIIGRHCSNFFLEDDQREGRPERELKIARMTGRIETEGWRVRRDGTRFWANVIISAVRDDSGELQGYFKITRDISERKASADQILELNSSLERQVVQLATANRELEQKNQENEMFVYSVSHDLRSPLVNLQGFSKELEYACQDIRQILVENEIPADVQTRGLTLIDEEIGESIHFIQSAVLRLSNIIDALLRLSRAGRVEFHPQKLDVREIVCRVVESLAGTAAEKGARVTVHELPPAFADAAAVEQVFANLLSNALKYLDPDRPGVIDVGYTSEAVIGGERTGAYFVRDNGLGIAEEYQAKVFQPFQRLHGAVATGEGMGLAIIRRVVERLGGQVWLESEKGEGTTFYVALSALATAKDPIRRTELVFPTDERGSKNERRTVGHCVGGR